MRRPHRRCIRTVCGRSFAAGPSEGGHEAPTLAPQGTRAKTWAARAAALSTTRRKIDVINASRGVKNTDGPNANRESSMRKRRAGRSRRRARAGAGAGAGAARHSAPQPHHDLRHVSTLAPELGVHVVLSGLCSRPHAPRSSSAGRHAPGSRRKGGISDPIFYIEHSLSLFTFSYTWVI